MCALDRALRLLSIVRLWHETLVSQLSTADIVQAAVARVRTVQACGRSGGGSRLRNQI